MEMTIKEQHEVKTKLRKMFSFIFDPSSFFYYVLLLIAVGLGFFAYALFTEHFTTPFSGDYSQQAYPFYYNFYDDWWTFFKTGKFPFYDANTFIGADNIYANTYYGLFSPFTFPILFFPRSFIPQAMALCSIAKLVTGGLLFRVYLKYMGCTEKTARIFSIAYAFTGWMGYYLWFNTFYEVLSFLPLILFGVEKVIRERKVWAIALGFFLLGIGNYFFLLTLGIFGVIYSGFRYFQTLKQRTLKENLLVIAYGFAGFLLGFMLCAVVVAPAVLSSFGINRSTNGKYWPTLKEAIINREWFTVLKMMFTYWHPNVANWNYDPYRYYFAYGFPLASYFFPTVSGRYVNVIHYTEFENSGSSIFYFTPCIILFFASMFRSIKNGKVSHLIAFAIILVCLFTPFFYFLIGAFSNCYGRWEIIVPVVGITYIALNFDHREEMSRLSIIFSGLLAFICMIGVFFLAKFMIATYGAKDGVTAPHIEDFGDVWGVIIYEMVLVILETFLFGKFWKKSFLPIIVNVCFIAECIILGNVVANMHYLQSIETSVNGGEEQLRNETAIIDGINKQDNSFFRIQSPSVDESHPNLPDAEGYNGISTFHTFYNNEVDDFVHMTQITNHDTSWSGLAYGKHANLDEFLGVKYYLTNDLDTTYYVTYSDGHVETVVFPENVPLNYEYIESLSGNGYKVWQNKYQINFGISYDVLYYKHTRESNPIFNDFYRGSYLYGDFVRNEEALFSGAILNDEDVEEVLKKYPDTFESKTAPAMEARDIGVRLKGIYGIHEENCWFDPFKPLQYINDDHLIDPSESELSVKKYQLVYEPTSSLGYFEIGEEGAYYLFDYPTRQTWGEDYSAVVFMIGMDDQVIKFDDLQAGANSNASGHIIRGLYSKEKVKYLIVVPLGSAYYRSLPPLYYEDWGHVLDRYQNAIDNGLTDVTFSVNDFTFKTNYEKERFVITQVTYTPGWKVVAKNSAGVKTELKTYNSQGGFVGFVAPKGDTSYEMSYMTPNIDKWFIVSLGGFIGVMGLSITPLLIRKYKKDSKKESN